MCLKLTRQSSDYFGVLDPFALLITQVAGYRVMCACHPSTIYAIAYNKVAVARSVTAPES